MNVRPVIYWVRRFAEFGFYPDLVLDASFLSPQAFVVRRGTPVPDDVLVLFAETVTNRIHRISLMARQENIMDLLNLRICDRIGTGRPKEQPFRFRKYKAMVDEALRFPV